tara:strand:- start:86 stop:541 length:456 start_codon:yes stop_codon:yes gene_type:complete
MRDLRNPLAPSIFKGEGKKRRQAKKRMRQEDRRDRKGERSTSPKLPSVSSKKLKPPAGYKCKTYSSKNVCKYLKSNLDDDKNDVMLTRNAEITSSMGYSKKTKTKVKKTEVKKKPESVNEVSNKRRKKSSVPKSRYRKIGGGKTTPNRRMR